MGFFKSEPPPPPPTSHVGPKTVLRGDLSSSCAVAVEGAVEGSVATKATLSIASGGRVEGKVRVGRLECAGTIRGETAVSGAAVFESSAAFDGDCASGALVVRRGARMEGRFSRQAPRP